MIQKIKKLSAEWHFFTSATIDEIDYYVGKHGISADLLSKTNGHRVGKAICSFHDGEPKVLNHSRAADRKKTLALKKARQLKSAIAA